MTELASVAPAEHVPRNRSVSIPMVVLTGLLCGVGLLGTAYWLVTLDWLYFLSLVPLTVGAVLLFSRATGADHA